MAENEKALLIGQKSLEYVKRYFKAESDLSDPVSTRGWNWHLVSPLAGQVVKASSGHSLSLSW